MKKRTLYFDLKKQINHKNALIVCGMRQVGKTTLMKLLYNDLDESKLWYDFDNPIDLLLFENIDYNQIYYNLAKQVSLKKGKRLFVFIDEIQNFPEITKIIKHLIDNYKVKFIVSGSSNFYMRNLFPESLSGRKFLYTLLPLSFAELLYFNNIVKADAIKNINVKNIFAKHTRYEHGKRNLLYDEYIEYGGFPEVVLTKDEETRKLILKNIFASFFEKDIRLLTELKDVRELRDLILLLAPRNGNLLDVSKLASELGLNRVKIYSYLEFLQGVFFLNLIPKFSNSIDKSVAGGRKVYFSDTGLLNLIAKVTESQLLETCVYNQIKQYGNITFYNKRNSAEIDFILNKETAFEVKINSGINDEKKLCKIANSLNIKEYFIISKKYNNFEKSLFPHFL